MGRAEYGEAADFAAVDKFTGYERRLNGLADTDVVGNEHSHGIQF